MQQRCILKVAWNMKVCRYIHLGDSSITLNGTYIICWAGLILKTIIILAYFNITYNEFKVTYQWKYKVRSKVKWDLYKYKVIYEFPSLNISLLIKVMNTGGASFTKSPGKGAVPHRDLNISSLYFFLVICDINFTVILKLCYVDV